jgi:ferritin-like metal-binding protein YciE
MAATPARDAKLVQLLNEAYTKEKQLEVALSSHIQMTTRDDYAKRLKDHLKETKSHASQVSKRIKQLGGTPETVSLPGPEGLTKAAEAVSGVLGKAKAAAQGPLHAVRGSGEQERMLQNARTEYQEEAWEIATYTIIDAVAAAAGDKPTAKLARDILRQEQRMQQFLGNLLPELSADVAHDEIPVAEIDGPGSRRTSADSKPQSSSSRATKARSSSSRATKAKSSSSAATKASTRKKTASGGSRAKSAGKAKKT